MEITKIKIRNRAKEGSRMKAFVSVTLDNEFVVHGIRVIEGDRGLFIAMPSRKVGPDTHKDIAHPLSQSVRDKFESAILDSYAKTGDEDRDYEFDLDEGNITEVTKEE